MKKKVTYILIVTIMKKFYLIQGVIFQEGSFFSLGNKLEIGVAVKIHKAMFYAMFHAVVGSSDDEKEVFCGQMNDKWGDSEITDFKMSKKELSFTKKYENRPPINYFFNIKAGNVWMGRYTGADCGKGTSKCIVTPVNEYFFKPTLLSH